MPKRAPLPIPADIDARLSDADFKVRAEAVRELGDTRNPEAVTYLLPLMNDKTVTVRGKVAQQLKKFVGKDPRALPALIRIAGEPSHGVHKWVWDFLLKQGKTIVPTIVEMLSDPDENVRHGCIMLLWYIDRNTLLSVLSTVIRDPHPRVQSLVKQLPGWFEEFANEPASAMRVRDMMQE
jgi:HEAT repeat protein